MTVASQVDAKESEKTPHTPAHTEHWKKVIWITYFVYERDVLESHSDEFIKILLSGNVLIKHENVDAKCELIENIFVRNPDFGVPS